MFDRSKNYYKIFREDDNHNDFQYKDGLNIDTIPFNDNPNKSCVEGGFYFSDAEYICEFLSYGEYIREVEIPEDTKVIELKDYYRWRSDKLFLHDRRDLRKIETWEWMIEQGINIHAFNETGLRWASYCGYFNIVKFLVEHGADINADNNDALKWVCNKGHVVILKYLVDKSDDSIINYHELLHWSRKNNNIEMRNFLQSKINEESNDV